jgi:hydrogenase maturation protease
MIAPEKSFSTGQSQKAIERQACTLVIGLGNLSRGDDALGRLVARRLKERNFVSVRIEECEGDGTELMELWRGVEKVIVVDAILSAEKPGTFYRIEATLQPVAGHFLNSSTHNFGLAEAIELARVLGELPPHLVIYGMVGNHFAMNAQLSAEVAEGLEDLLQQLQAELKVQ